MGESITGAARAAALTTLFLIVAVSLAGFGTSASEEANSAGFTAFASSGDQVGVYRLDAQQEQGSFQWLEPPENSAAWNAGISPDGRWIALDYGRYILDLVTGDWLRSDMIGSPFYMLWSPNSDYVIVHVTEYIPAERALTLIIDVTTGECLRTFAAHLASIEISPDGRHFVFQELDGSVKLSDVFSEHEPQTVLESAYHHLRWSPEGRWLAAAIQPDDSTARQIVIIDPHSRQIVWRIDLPGQSTPLAWSPDGRYLLFEYLSDDLSLIIADVITQETHELQGQEQAVLMDDPLWSPDSTRLAFMTPAGLSVYAVESATWQRLSSPPVHEIAGWSPTDDYLLLRLEDSAGLLSLNTGSTLIIDAGYAIWLSNGQLVYVREADRASTDELVVFHPGQIGEQVYTLPPEVRIWMLQAWGDHVPIPPPPG